MSLTQSYEEKRDLLIGQLYKRSNTSVASRSYSYDTLGRPVTRSASKDGSTVNDTFGYNSRSELNAAMVNNEAYAYDYDNIGNRETAQEAAESATSYESNQLNQYTAIGDFEPSYDDAGNQTKVKTSTGIWSVVYNAENRPTSFTNADSGTVVECTYDYMGRRATKKVTVNGSVTLHQRFLYRGYLQIACCDLSRSNHPCLWLITWDPLQPVATRPLAIQKDGTWYTYGWDLTKDICEVYGQHGYIRTNYSYSPYGEVTANGDVIQPVQWSSEFNDTELGLIYYNYRHYNPVDGRWIGRDKIVEMEHQNLHVYPYVANSPLSLFDILGLDAFPCNRENKGRYKELKIKIYLQTLDGDIEIIDTENANIGKIIKDEIIDRAKSKVHGDMRDRLKQKIESNEMFRSMKKELEDVANGIKKHPVFKFLKNGISTTSGTILGVKIDVEAKFCICRNGEHEFVNCHGTAETFPIRIAIASLNRDSVKRLKRLPEYFAQASYSAVEELYKVKTYHEKK